MNHFPPSLLALMFGANSLLAGASLPAGYFHLMEAGIQKVQLRLDSQSNADLATLESAPGWKHFPYAILAPAVLYAKKHPANSHYRDSRMLELAIKIGDLLALENEKGTFEPRLDSDWDAGLWLETYLVLGPELGNERRSRWKREIEKNVVRLVPDLQERMDFPWYNSPYIGTSPNHYAFWASLVYQAGCVFGRQDWQKLGRQIMQRYATLEQTSDGYWGEHSRSGPTTGYNHLTFTALATYWEYSHDPVVLPALRRATSFHKYYTYPDGIPVEVINDRNRHWEVNTWGHFGFSHFPDGRRLAEFLTGFISEDKLDMSSLGRLSQDALYFHEGSQERIPQDQPRFVHQMNVPAGIRKDGPWVYCLSGIISTSAVENQFYLDRQSHFSVFHEKTGLIITGANSKHQPELATFYEDFSGQLLHMPLSSRLILREPQDRLSLAFSTFFSDLLVAVDSSDSMHFEFDITGKGTPPQEARLTLQLCLKSGEPLESGAGRKVVLGSEPINWGAAEIGGWIRHRGWVLKTDADTRLVWPVFPFNPYRNAPETGLEWAVGALSVPLNLVSQGEEKFIRPHQQKIIFRLSVPSSGNSSH